MDYFEEVKKALKELGIPLDENAWNFVGKFKYFYDMGIEDGKKEMKDKIFRKIKNIEDNPDVMII